MRQNAIRTNTDVHAITADGAMKREIRAHNYFTARCCVHNAEVRPQQVTISRNLADLRGSTNSFNKDLDQSNSSPSIEYFLKRKKTILKQNSNKQNK